MVAGPNGAGKSTLVEAGVVADALGCGLVNRNADVRAREIRASAPDAPNVTLRAAIEIDAEVARCIEQGVDVLVETVLSSDKYVDDIEHALAIGYRFGLIYVALATPEDAVRRVALRRAMGGHDVPTDRVIARWSRSLATLRRVAPHAHVLYVFDNTATSGPVLIARGAAGKVTLLAPGRIPEIDAALTGADDG